MVFLMICVSWLLGRLIGKKTSCDNCKMKDLCMMCRRNGEVPPCDQ